MDEKKTHSDIDGRPLGQWLLVDMSGGESIVLVLSFRSIRQKKNKNKTHSDIDGRSLGHHIPVDMSGGEGDTDSVATSDVAGSPLEVGQGDVRPYSGVGEVSHILRVIVHHQLW